MEANLFLLLATGVFSAAGVYLLLDRSMTKMMLGILLIGHLLSLALAPELYLACGCWLSRHSYSRMY